MEDKEIVKALECCGIGEDFKVCDDCPCCIEGEKAIDCVKRLHKATLDLINRLQAENGIYETCNARKDEAIKHLESEVKRLQAENERLKAPTNDWLVKGISKEQLQEEKIQAFTEEINRLQAENERLQDAIDEQDIEIASLWKRIEDAKAEAYKEFAELLHCYCEGVINQEWNSKVAPISWAIAYGEFEDVIDYQLKELVGEDDESKN